MGVTNEFERDVNDTSFLKRPGRVDLIVFQNTADCGDGHPGLQRAFRNYLHEGGMEKDLDVNSFDIKNVIDIELSGEIVFPTATIHSTGTHIHIHPNTGNADGELHLHPLGTNTASIIFIRNSGTANYGNFQFKIDGLIASLEGGLGGGGTAPDTLNMNDSSWDNINIGDTSCSVVISGVTINNGIVDGVDVSAIKLNSMPAAADGDIDANSQKIINVVNPTLDQGAATKKYVDDYIKAYLPIGTILMFNGAGWVDNTTIPGWYKCDGNNGTVNLVDKFVRGGTTSGATGGSDNAVVVQHNHGITDPMHDHKVRETSDDFQPGAVSIRYLDTVGTWLENLTQDRVTGITVNDEGVSGTNANIPAYYTLIYIQRIS